MEAPAGSGKARQGKALRILTLSERKPRDKKTQTFYNWRLTL
jgi:hypothetical protein